MKVALVHAPFIVRNSPPPALAVLAACLRAGGHEPVVFDFNNRLYHEVDSEMRRFWLMGDYDWSAPDAFLRRLQRVTTPLWDRYLAELASCGAGVYGFSAHTAARYFSLFIAERLKRARPDAKIVFGGPDCAPECDLDFYRTLSFIDAIVPGEAETVLPEIVSRWEAGRPLEGCAGVLLRGQKGNPLPAPLVDLNAVPLMDFSGFPLDTYLYPNELPLCTSRGCVRRCDFCLDWKMWAPYRSMSGDRIHAEMRHQLERHPGVRRFWFQDSLINGNRRAFDRFLDLLLDPATALPRPVEWYGMAILHPMLDEARLARMRRAGCVHLAFGFESASPDVLARMRKGFRVEVAERVVEACARAGILVEIMFIAGYPTETEEDFSKTLAFVERHASQFHLASVSIFSLRPAADTAAQREMLIVDWEGANHLFWRTRDGANTVSVRLDRHRRLAEALERGGVPIVRRDSFAVGLEKWGLTDGQLDRLGVHPAASSVGG